MVDPSQPAHPIQDIKSSCAIASYSPLDPLIIFWTISFLYWIPPELDNC